jgi:tRNA pseudouridine13 synthase
MDTTLPFLTADLTGIGGVIKTREEDFVVEEVPLYEPSGAGSHAYAFIEKKGISTRQALGHIGRALNVSLRHLGSAGLKDARAVTRQWISVEHVDPARLAELSLSNVRILRTDRHRNKLKPGHLAGNRFVIRLRQVKEPLAESARIAGEVLSVLARRGVPNYFGPQRFGDRQSNHLLGRAIIDDDVEGFVHSFLGRPQEGLDNPATLRARTLFEQGSYQEAVGVWPRRFHEHRRALKAIVRSSGDLTRAYQSVDRHLKGFFISAYQSALFNRVLAARMPRIDTLLLGDMAYKHDNGACFAVEEPDVEQPRCDAFDVSPTGPLLGPRMTRLTGPAGDIENPLLDAEELSQVAMQQMRRLGSRGGRRPLRFQPRHVDVGTGGDDLGPYIELSFELDPGCYATCLVAEITKDRHGRAISEGIPNERE